MITYVSLFSGIGGFDLGFDRAGMICRAQVEWDAKARAVLAYHWPNVKRYEDVRHVGKATLPAVDVVCGGFPCQDVSVAGRRAGLAGERSGLWFEFARIIREIKPKWVVVENVRGLLSSNNGRDFGRILADLAECGYDAEWEVLSACAIGAPHTRERLFIVAYPTGHRRKGDVFKAISQEIHNLSSKTLGTWNGISDPQSYIQKLMASPGNCRLADGVSSTVAVRPALRGYGNAVVPALAEAIGRAIVKLHSTSDFSQFTSTNLTIMNKPMTVRAEDSGGGMAAIVE